MVAKPTPFDATNETLYGADLFASIVPMEVHKMNSVFSEKKADLLRQVNDMVASKDEELRFARVTVVLL